MKLDPITRRQTPAGRLALSALLGAGLCIFLSFTLTSCDSGKGQRKRPAGESEESGVDDADPQAKAEDLLSSAKKMGMAKAAPDEMAQATKLIEDGKQAAEDSKNDDAAKKFKSAARKLQAWIDERKTVQDAVKKAAEARTAAQEAQKKANAAKAQQNAPDLYKQASESLKTAVAMIDKATSVKSVEQAKRDLIRATDLFDQAARSSSENESVRKMADVEKKVMLEMKEKAKANGAEEKDSTAWLNAGQVEREADGLLASGDFRSALETYKQATQRYSSALQNSVDATTFETMTKEAQAKEDQDRILQVEQQRKAAEQRAAEEKAEVVAKPKPKAFVQAPAILIFEGFDPSKYPQDDVDAEDDALVLDNYKKLSQKLEYDSATGAATIDYTIGEEMKVDFKEDLACKQLQQKGLLDFIPPIINRKVEVAAEDRKKKSPFSFTANTQGLLTLPVPFRYYVRMEFSLSILTMDKVSSFSCLAMLDKKSNSAYMTNWLTAGTMSGGIQKLFPLTAGEHAREYNQPADRWFTKQREVPMLVEFRMPDPDPKRAGKDSLKSGLFTITYDVEDNIKTATNMIPTKGGSQRGFVAFQWNRVKFEVRKLEVTGILDKKLAADILREKLKMPKVAKEESKDKAKANDKAKAKAKEDESGGGDGDPGDSSKKDDSSKDSSKKPKKPFDF